jgi:hypothetical protein
MTQPGFRLFGHDADVMAWAQAAHHAACGELNSPAIRTAQIRHGGTWFVGVDTLPNAADGSVSGVSLRGPWQDQTPPPAAWHRAQVSVVYPGYPHQDAQESDANHRYRIVRFAAHVDGLLPVGPDKRRYLQEPHMFILGLPLNASDAAPLMVWPGSQRIMGDAFRAAIAGQDPAKVDLTEAYHAARRRCFRELTPEAVQMAPGQSVLLHRHLLHGVAPWEARDTAPQEGRMVAYFRPHYADSTHWLKAP